MDRYSPGKKVEIIMNIKPRSPSGLLLSVHGKKDYLILEMVNGTIKFIVKTSQGLLETSNDMSKKINLCDGGWHSIKGIYKIIFINNEFLTLK